VDAVHAVDQRAQVALDDEVLAVALERLDRGGRTAAQSRARELARVAPGDVGILLGPRQRELLLDDLLRQHEPGVLVCGARDVLERAERVEAGEQRDGQPPAGRVEPQ
jgi:hypothetical protein